MRARAIAIYILYKPGKLHFNRFKILTQNLLYVLGQQLSSDASA